MVVKTYDEYQKTELPWLTKVPSHWTWLRNKNIYAEKKEIVGDRKTEFKLLSLTKKGIIIRDVSSGKGKFPKDFDTYKVVNPGDMVFCLFDVDETPRTVGLSNYRGMITGAYDVFGIHGINSKYAYYYYLAFDNLKAYKPLYSGLRKTIPLPSFMATKIPVPPKEEQEQIACYLDWKTSEIDRFVHQKKKQIKRLKDLRIQTINNAITRGINNNVECKDTGIDWLPSMPSHWELKKLRNFLTEVSDKNHPECQLLSVTRELGVIVRDVEDYESNHNYIPDDLSNYKRVKNGQFVINKMKAWQGSYGLSVYDGIVSPAYYVFDLKFKNKEFFHWAIRSKIYVNFFAQYSDGIRVGQWDLSKEKLKTIPFLVPPENEQAEIVEFLKEQSERIEEQIKSIETEIELLQELRTKIIADVVTGQIDVRDVVIPEYSCDEDTDSDDVEDDEEEIEESED